MKLISWFNCRRGKHERSRSRVREDGAVFRSRCRGCGVSMVRLGVEWVVEKGGSGPGS